MPLRRLSYIQHTDSSRLGISRYQDMQTKQDMPDTEIPEHRINTTKKSAHWKKWIQRFMLISDTNGRVSATKHIFQGPSQVSIRNESRIQPSLAHLLHPRHSMNPNPAITHSIVLPHRREAHIKKSSKRELSAEEKICAFSNIKRSERFLFFFFFSTGGRNSKTKEDKQEENRIDR